MTAKAAERDAKVYARRWRTLAVLALSLVIIGLDNTILNVALPTLQDHYHASGSQLQWMVDSCLLVFAGLLLTMGTLGDRFGRKKGLLAGITIFGGASVAALVVDSSAQLIAVRALADGSRGVSLDVRFGGRVSALGWLPFGFLTAGAVVLLIGAALLYLGVRRPRDV